MQVNHVTVDLALNTYEANVTDPSGAIVIVKDEDLWSIEDIWGSRGDDFPVRAMMRFTVVQAMMWLEESQVPTWYSGGGMGTTSCREPKVAPVI